MMKKDEYEYRCLTEIWRLFRKYSTPVMNQEWWDKCLNDFIELEKKYKGNKLALDLLCAFKAEIDRRGRQCTAR